jgi:hypothetical protein
MADIRVRVGQENAIKVVASVSGSSGGKAVIAENVIGGIASVSQLSVSGISTFGDSVSIAGSLTAGSFSVNNLTNNNLVTGIVTISNQLYYTAYDSGVAYFNPSGLVVSTGAASTTNSIDYSNYVLTTNNVGIITWTSVLDGGTY